MEELSLVIQQPKSFITNIVWNKDEIKSFIEQKLKDYKNVVYTEDTIKDAKADRAYLNKMKKSISARRIEVKNAILAPYNEFEDGVKEILAPIDEAITEIDATIKGAEAQKKKERREALEKHYETYDQDFRSMVGFDRLLNDKMLLASKTEKKAISELDEAKQKIQKILADLDTLKMSVEEQDMVYAQERYLATFDVAEVIREMHELSERRKAAKEASRRAQEQQEAAKTSQTVNSASERTETVETANNSAQQYEQAVDPFLQQPEAPVNALPAAEEVTATAPEPKQEEPAVELYRAKFIAIGTKQQLIDLRQYMIDSGIRFE